MELDENHNLQLQLASTSDNNDVQSCIIDESEGTVSIRRQQQKIIRASPICESMTDNNDNMEEEGIECSRTAVAAVGSTRVQKWMVNDNGKIILVPPSPTTTSPAQEEDDVAVKDNDDVNNEGGDETPSIISISSSSGGAPREEVGAPTFLSPSSSSSSSVSSRREIISTLLFDLSLLQL